MAEDPKLTLLGKDVKICQIIKILEKSDKN